MARIQFIHTYQYIISLENLLLAWKDFLKGKKLRKDVLDFERNLMANIIELHNELSQKTYKHSDYYAFNISDPKPRSIHKARVRDRLLHHALYRELYPFFDKTFIADSYSCRERKGTHKALQRFKMFSDTVSKNNTRTVWILKCDIRKFFASIDHSVLIGIIKKYISDEDILSLLSGIIGSFHSTRKEVGLPLGNLTSQIFVNIYMNEFDQFVKHKLKAQYYIRYADDFVFLSEDKKWLETILPQVGSFLKERLKLSLHPNKVFIKTLASGVDFLGWVHFPDHRIVRTATKRRMWKRIKEKEGKEETVQSYLGLLSHGNAERLAGQVVEYVKRSQTADFNKE
jgi:retron-type reverse transcriptase